MKILLIIILVSVNLRLNGNGLMVQIQLNEFVPQLKVLGTPEMMVTVEWTSDITRPWSPLTNVILSAGGITAVNLDREPSQRFYRAVVKQSAVGPKGFVWIPPGTFVMGSPSIEEGRMNDEEQHKVVLSRGFWLADHEVTQFEYRDVMGLNPSLFQGDSQRPVEQVTWDNAVLYCQRLTERERTAGRITAQQSYRLPTEAEWEYAARAGTTGVRYGELNDVAWWFGNSLWRGERETWPIALKEPNVWGLFDMIGNVSEWCSDWIGGYPIDSVAVDPRGPDSGLGRVVRGWSYGTEAKYARVAARSYFAPDKWYDFIGFRPALSSTESVVEPSIVWQPQAAAATVGNSCQFNVIAIGSSPLKIQWQLNGINLVNETNSVIKLKNIKLEDSGDYRVIVSNNAGRVTSAVARLTVNTNATGGPIGFVWIPPGTFKMGSPESEIGRDINELQHTVAITRGYWISDHEVTQAEYQAVMGNNPSAHLGDLNRPVESVSWNDAVMYCQRLTERERLAGRITSQQAYRLPTEAEWEYAARSGTTGTRYGELDAISWVVQNSEGTQPVNGKAASGWGVHDMIGNVAEWCYDWFGEYSSDTLMDPSGATSGSQRVNRGGCWYDNTSGLRSARRGNSSPDVRLTNLGFRPVFGSYPPTITQHPQSIVIMSGKTARFTVSVLETNSVEYQWQFNGESLRGEIQATLELSNVQSSNSGNYRVIVKNAAGISSSTLVWLKVTPKGPSGPQGFVWIPPGNFIMGSSKSELYRSLDEVQHSVTITQGFWISDHEVTQGEFQEIMGNNPSHFNSDLNRPVDRVNWNEAVMYCQKLTQKERLAGRITAQQSYRLPTEAEWEYAARAGTTGARYDDLEAIAWWKGNSGEMTWPVKSKKPNDWGLYDVFGNVSEWCLDWNEPYTGGAVVDPVGESGQYRVFRGGNFGSLQLRSAERGGDQVESKNLSRGFRPALSANPPTINQQPESISVKAGEMVRFSVTASGASKLEYEWQFNGTNMIGENQSTLVINAAQYSDAGEYQVKVTDINGSLISRAGILSVNDPSRPLPPVGYVWIHPGTFTMGSPDTEFGRESDEFQHTVTITRGFWISDHEVTQGEYQAVIGSNPSWYGGNSNQPVERVSWNDAVKYCQKLTERERLSGRITATQAYRLPTEAEWEYAARAGETWLGPGELVSIAWFSDNSSNRTRPVGQRAPNAWKLYDMLGNVAEWCSDRYGVYPTGFTADPVGPNVGQQRVFRGGSWLNRGDYLRPANRDCIQPTYSHQSIGFRPVISLPQ